ncbi:MAG: YetF domain-containing protein [Candidatus Limnocylindrales bacterium]
MLGFDIGQALTPDVSLFETVVRGVVMYLAILVLMRYVLRGKTSASMPDLLVIVLIADAAQNAMSAEYSSITNGITLVATIIGMSTLLDFLGQRNATVGRFIHPERRPLIVNGRIIRKTLASELMSEEELLTQLRLQGTESVVDVKAAYLEGTGEVSVIKHEQGGGDTGKKKGPGAT